jgi:thiamine biosynthesis lipoprotein
MPGYHHVEAVMGTSVTIDVHDEVTGSPGLTEVVEWLHHVDRTFSTYRPDSPISRLGRGELTLSEVGDEVRVVLLQCEALRSLTRGAFDAFVVPAPNGTDLDPSGLVKGWSVERAAGLLEAYGLRRFCLNAGGDVLVRGEPSTGRGWRVGIRHPEDPQQLAAVLEVRGPMAVATSGTYERGAHIIDPRTGAPTAEVASVTVVGPDLALADAYATAVFVMGTDGASWISEQPGYEALILTHDRRRVVTAGFHRFLAGVEIAANG